MSQSDFSAAQIGRKTGEMASEITPRRIPVQARSRERVERILDAAARLLVEEGYDAVKTNRLAKHAGVSIGSIYQFFPNKNAIFHALAARHLDQVAEALARHITSSSDTVSWELAIEKIVDDLARLWKSHEAYHAVWLAIQNTMELRKADDHYNDIFVNENLLAFLNGILPETDEKKLRSMGRIMFEISASLLDYSMRNRPEQDEFAVQDLKLVLKSYIKGRREQERELAKPSE